MNRYPNDLQTDEAAEEDKVNLDTWVTALEERTKRKNRQYRESVSVKDRRRMMC